MADGFWMIVLLTVGGMLLALSTFGAAALRRLVRMNRNNGERIDELSQRLRLIEARLGAGASTVVHAARSDRPRRSIPPATGPAIAAAAPTLIAVPNMAASPIEQEQEPGPGSPSESVGRHDDVRSLARAGVSPDLIARRTNRPVGQVELILALQKRRQGPRRAGPHARPE
ncbi:hypothetical protein [Aquisphaera insulae]|uniref:hypothetical protein n=1 Tax=Aquisphaera insulae TaxID=2712864 RepID=UPI0013ED5283|nr:hypothetical protein [Aquisphaera insulae]